MQISKYEWGEEDKGVWKDVFRKKNDYHNPSGRVIYREWFKYYLKNNFTNYELKNSLLKVNDRYFICDFTNENPAIEKNQIKQIRVKINDLERIVGVFFKRYNKKEDTMFGFISWESFKECYKINETLDDDRQSYRIRSGNKLDKNISKIEEFDIKKMGQDKLNRILREGVYDEGNR